MQGHDWNFVGLHNYIDFFTASNSRDKLKSLKKTIEFSLSVTVIQNVVAMVLALILNSRIRGFVIYRTFEFNDRAVEAFTNEWQEIVHQQYNHPCIITWVPFNESWGIPNIPWDTKQQQFTEAIYHLTKSIDPYRLVITNDGWEHTVSDILTLHDYEEFGTRFWERYKDKDAIVNNKIAFSNWKYAFADGYGYRGQPILISEFGGIAFQSEKGGDMEIQSIQRKLSLNDSGK